MTYAVGQRVRFVAIWCDPREADARFTVVEDNGDRVFIALECDLPIRPVETVRPYMIEPVEETHE